MKARRIIVYGVTGSGKSILAKRIAEQAQLPYVSVDDLTWLPNWQYVPFEGQRRIFTDICAEDAWVLDSAYAHWIDIPLERVELIIALDYPRWVSFGRLVKRTFQRMTTGETVCNGNRESLRVTFSRESILLWHFRSFARKRARILEWEREGQPIVVLRSHREAMKWLMETSETNWTFQA